MLELAPICCFLLAIHAIEQLPQRCCGCTSADLEDEMIRKMADEEVTDLEVSFRPVLRWLRWYWTTHMIKELCTLQSALHSDAPHHVVSGLEHYI